MIAAMVVALYGMQGAAHASSTSSTLTFFGPANHLQASGRDFGPNSDWPIGDCWMLAGLNNGSYVEITATTTRVVEADYLVAADGFHSPVRQALGIETDGPGPLFTTMTAIVKADLTASHRRAARA